ncbi:MAG: type II toxin-antitoxin system RelE/ParE family toxin [Candidatus Micrarchaeota archaeon]
MGYKIRFDGPAADELAALDKPIREQIYKKIAHLGPNPYLGEPLSNALKNKRRLHVGKYRVIYLISGETVVIARVGHRKDVYE